MKNGDVVVSYGADHEDKDKIDNLTDSIKTKYDKDYGMLSGRYDSIVNKAEL
jgi:hypothetical protein